MRRIQKIMTGVFLGGVLLGGIGTGTAVVEYSTLSYGGERLIGEEYLVTRNLDFDFAQDGKTLILVNNYYLRQTNAKIETDETVPVGTVRYEVTYNEKRVTPELFFEKYQEDGFPEPENMPKESDLPEESQEVQEEHKEPVYLGYLQLSVCDHDNAFAVFMENKDYFMEELKQKRISSYKEAYITKVNVKVNPQTRPYVEGGNSWY